MLLHRIINTEAWLPRMQRNRDEDQYTTVTPRFFYFVISITNCQLLQHSPGFELRGLNSSTKTSTLRRSQFSRLTNRELHQTFTAQPALYPGLSYLGGSIKTLKDHRTHHNRIRRITFAFKLGLHCTTDHDENI